ncbi:uncharacterized [Tachysurus ichikawai]
MKLSSRRQETIHQTQSTTPWRRSEHKRRRKVGQLIGSRTPSLTPNKFDFSRRPQIFLTTSRPANCGRIVNVNTPCFADVTQEVITASRMRLGSCMAIRTEAKCFTSLSRCDTHAKLQLCAN